MRNTKLIFDCDNLLHRVLHVDSIRNIIVDGNCMGGVFGVLRSIIMLAKKFYPNSIFCVFGGGISSKRIEIYENYKKKDLSNLSVDEHKNREEYFKDYNNNKRILCNNLAKFGITCINYTYEADDMIWQVVNYIRSNNSHCNNIVIVSEDKDMYQFIDIIGVGVYRPIVDKYVTKLNFKDITGLNSSKHYLVYKSIMGDRSDNIPKIEGVGDKTLIPFLNCINDILDFNNLKKELIRQNNKRLLKVLADFEIVERNFKLINIIKYCPSECQELIDLYKPIYKKFDFEQTYRFLTKCKFDKLLEDFNKWAIIFQEFNFV